MSLTQSTGVINVGNGIHTGTLKTTQKKTIFVRALFEYDPAKDSGLPGRGLHFRHGDILHVTNASDDEWWQARKLVGDLVDQGLCIIPSKKRIERKEKLRNRNVKFVGKEGDSSSLSSQALVSEKKKRHFFSKKLHITKSKEKSKSENVLNVDASKANGDVNPSIRSYETVVRQELQYTRPVILFGPLKDRISDDLIAEFSDQFASCVPHTTRPRKETEVDGREYHFVVSREEMERDMTTELFVESGQYNDNLYGTSVAAVRDVAEQGKHCILDVSPNAIKRLQRAGLPPITICIKARSIESIMEWNKRMSAEQARITFERALKQESEFGHCYTAIIMGDTPEDIYSKIKETIQAQSGTSVWVPATTADRL